MKQISFTKRQFPKTQNGTGKLHFTVKALLRAVVAAGQKPIPGKKPAPAQADINMRINALKSAIDMSGSALLPTTEYLAAGSTDQAHKSFYVGNALCAHAAYSDLNIPWLVDFERLGTNYKIKNTKSKRRPDFLGLDTSAKWFVFESKGRSSSPGPADLKCWKKQVRGVKQVNSRKVRQGIVSAGYLSNASEWELLWVDPPPEKDAEAVIIDEPTFFDAYYRPILEYLDRTQSPNVDAATGTLTLSGESGIYIGLHREITSAVLARNWSAILSFAARMEANEDVGPDDTSIFRDGLIIRLGPEWEAGSRGRLARPSGGLREPHPRGRSSVMMPTVQIGIGKPERETQSRVVGLFRDELKYRYLGDWTDRPDNSNIEEKLLEDHLTRTGYTPEQINRALYLLKTEAENPNRSLYDNNKAVYSFLRYGVPVKIEAGKVTETVKLINWEEPQENDFAIAEEVTLRGELERRPDLVLYVNGIAVGVIELKNSYVSIGNGIRQLLSNQQKEFHEWFFATVQIVFAGNDSEGLRYGAVGTGEKCFLKWKEDEADDSRFKLDKYLLKLCNKERLIELMHDFVLFDGGVKKLPRAHQYFGIKAAQDHVKAYKGGIIWHTQGSGKSIVMVLLAKWILENKPNARVLIITDRDELDKQIEGVFKDSGESIYRTSSGHDLIAQLRQAKPRLLCSLVHKFGKKGVNDFDAFIAELKKQPSPAVGELFIFVDECHRTQSGKLNKTMKALLPSAVFIGFTGTPLLKEDKETSLEVFGDYIDTYKFGEGVEDGVVLDLVYEARDIEQNLGSQDKIDAWFDAKTKGLNEWQKAALREQWGTMQKVLSSRSRMERVVEDIVFDFGVKPRLSSQRGNAMLVASSIYEAAEYFELFQKTIFKGKCGLVTSHNPMTQDVTLEETGANNETEKQFLYNTYTALLKGVVPKPGKTKTETYEDEVKELFKTQPANMRLLIVVDKLLTGFDAPACTYLYVDKSMQDHGLFQAICRTNRLDGEDKTFGYIVDYKDLFKKLVNEKGTGALQVYTSELDHSAGGTSPEVLMQDRLKKGKERLDQALESVALLCEPVQPPKGELEHIHYFCGNTEIPDDLKAHEAQRAALYKSTAALLRAYANIADDLLSAGYGESERSQIKQNLNRYVKLREIIRQASGETIDLKAYEADMRHLIDTYIEAKEPRKISEFDEMGLLDVVVKSGMADAVSGLPDGIKSNKSAVAETIANNVRSKIIKEHLNDPVFYDKMSALLKEILADLKAKRIGYEEFLKRLAEQVIKPLQAGKSDDTPAKLDTPGKRALYNTLSKNEELALAIDAKVKAVRPADWRGKKPRENVIKNALLPLLGNNQVEVERVFLILFKQTEY